MNITTNIKTHIDILPELAQIMIDLGFNSNGRQLAFRWLEEIIILAIFYPDTWQDDYLERIGKRENLTRERVRQILYKAVWDKWSKESKGILEKHFEHPIKTQFKYVKPNHVEFISLISNELRKKHLEN